MEFATYDYNKGSNQLKISGFTYNTDGCIGFSGSDGSHGFTIGSDGNTAKLEKQGEEPVTVYRVSAGLAHLRIPISAHQAVGTTLTITSYITLGTEARVGCTG